MRISYNWLKEYIEITETPEKIGELLTSAGLEVEGIEKFESLKGGLEGIVIGEVKTCVQHPNADKLKVTTVDLGNGNVHQIVCGASNVAAGQKVVVATVGATLFPTKGESFTINKAKIRGEASEGMICAEDEIGLGTSHEGIIVLNTSLPNGTAAREYFKPYSDFIFEIGLTPNRADAASHLGVARDLSALIKKPLKYPNVNDFHAGKEKSPIEVIVENTDGAPRYSGIYIKGVQVKESSDWLKNKLKAIGLSPINNIVDITNYVLHSVGQPLHAFDADQIKGKKIRVKNLPEGTPFLSLDNIERKLKASDLMICDGESNGMCIGGVFGGINSGVKNSTKNIFLESAYFSPVFIRKSALNHGLKTDASFRFERGVNPDGTLLALKLAALLIQKEAGGSLSEVIDHYPNPIPEKTIKAEYWKIDRLIGVKLDRSVIKEILKSLEFKLSNETESGITVTVPNYRVDFNSEADLTEEIIRIYGFNNIPLDENIGTSYLAEHPERDANKLQFRTTEMLAASGFSEIITNSLTKPSFVKLIDGLKEEENVELLNPLSEDLKALRQSLIFSGLEVVSYNINRKRKNLKLFEFGKVYFKKEKGYQENWKLALFITGNKEEETWISKDEATDFIDLKTAVLKVCKKMDVQILDQQPLTDRSFIYGLELISTNKKSFAKLGLLNKVILKEADIKQQVWYAELDWDFLTGRKVKRQEYVEISKFPEVRRDLSLVLDKQVSFKDIQRIAKQYEKHLLTDINVFDVYEGENIGKDKKSYSVSFILQDKSQTLTDKVIDQTMDRLMKGFEKELGAIIRK